MKRKMEHLGDDLWSKIIAEMSADTEIHTKNRIGGQAGVMTYIRYI